MKFLVIFDFDNTVVDDNADTAIFTLVGKEEIPQDIKNIEFREGWIAFMQGVFTYLHDCGVTVEAVKNLVKNLPAVDSMIELLNELKKRATYDMIMISDCNTIFIKQWLEKNSVADCFLKVYSNPAEIVKGMFKITPYEIQDHCKLSSRNMCKGQILDNFVSEQRKNGKLYDKLIYVGDGVNDFCPVLRLKENDLACVRKKHKLSDLVNKARKGASLDNSGLTHVIHAEVLEWGTGYDIMKHLHMKE